MIVKILGAHQNNECVFPNVCLLGHFWLGQSVGGLSWGNQHVWDLSVFVLINCNFKAYCNYLDFRASRYVLRYGGYYCA